MISWSHPAHSSIILPHVLMFFIQPLPHWDMNDGSVTLSLLIHILNDAVGRSITGMRGMLSATPMLPMPGSFASVFVCIWAFGMSSFGSFNPGGDGIPNGKFNLPKTAGSRPNFAMSGASCDLGNFGMRGIFNFGNFGHSNLGHWNEGNLSDGSFGSLRLGNLMPGRIPRFGMGGNRNRNEGSGCRMRMLFRHVKLHQFRLNLKSL